MEPLRTTRSVVTLREVAARAGVSRSAVSRVFTPGASVSVAMRARVERAAADLGYAPNALASGLTTGRTKLIGLVLNNFHNPLILEVVDLFTRGLQDRGLRPLVVNLSEAGEPEATARLLRQYSVDGVIVASSTLPAAYAVAARDAGMPVVHAFGRPGAAPATHVVGIDNVACGRLAAETMLARGYRCLGFLGGPEAASSTQDRRAGFLAALEGRPGVRVTVRHAGAYSFEAGRAAMAGLAGDGLAEAWFCGDDLLAVGALSALREAGLAVPEDVGLLGLNGMAMGDWPLIGLTTIHQPIDRIIDAAIDLVAAPDGPETPPQVRLFPCHLVERRTLRPLG